MSLSEDLMKNAQDYLDDVMSHDAKRAFELLMKENQELAEYVAVNKEMYIQYNEEGWSFAHNESDVEELEGYLKGNEVEEIKAAIKRTNNHFTKNSSASKRNYFSYVAVAASIVLLVGYLVFNKAPSNMDLYAQYNDWNSLPSLTSRGTLDNTLLIQGEKAFLDKDYEKANRYFESYLTESQNNNTNALLYYGVSNIELNNYEVALATFNQLISSESIDRSKGYWYKAIMYLKKNETVFAVEALNEITKNPSNYNYKEALKLLKKIEK